MNPTQNPPVSQHNAVPQLNATSTPQAAPAPAPAPAPVQAVPSPMAPSPAIPVANNTVEVNPPASVVPQSQPTAAPATSAAPQPTLPQDQPVPTNSQIPYAQPGECKYQRDFFLPFFCIFSFCKGQQLTEDSNERLEIFWWLFSLMHE